MDCMDRHSLRFVSFLVLLVFYGWSWTGTRSGSYCGRHGQGEVVMDRHVFSCVFSWTGTLPSLFALISFEVDPWTGTRSVLLHGNSWTGTCVSSHGQALLASSHGQALTLVPVADPA